MMRSTMAPALPNMMAGRRYLSDRLWQAMAMTTALSPDRMMLAMMLFHNAAQNTADERSGSTKTIFSFLPARGHHSRLCDRRNGCYPVTGKEGRMASGAGYT